MPFLRPIQGSLLAVALCLAALDSAAQQSANTFVDFSAPLAVPMARHPFSGTISTYGSEGGSIVASGTQRAHLASLRLGMYRVPLQWNGGDRTPAPPRSP